MGKILVFIYDQMADFEITFTAQLVGGDLGKEVIPIAYDDKPIKAKSGMIYKPEKLVKDVLHEEVEGLIIPGGMLEEIRPEILELVNALNAKRKLIAAICAGPRVLAKAGVLNNVKYTTSIVNWTEKHAEQYMEEDPFPRQNFVMDRVVREGNIITAQGNAFVDFAIEAANWFGAFDGEEDKKRLEQIIKGK